LNKIWFLAQAENLKRKKNPTNQSFLAQTEKVKPCNQQIHRTTTTGSKHSMSFCSLIPLTLHVAKFENFLHSRVFKVLSSSTALGGGKLHLINLNPVRKEA
jgi:hypothetical protein